MIELKHITKTFQGRDGSFDALHDVSLTIPDGDIFGIIGMSGAGKSTLVRCINLLERPSEGSVWIDGQDVGTLSESALRAMRRRVTMIFQHFNLLSQRTCLKNICFPLELSRTPREEAERRARELLEVVGLSDKANAYPAQLSGGQKQRIAIARALATDPKVLLCDEATSALDPTTTTSILNLLREINERLGITIVIITHQMNVVESICHHVAILDSGSVVEQGEVGEVFAHPHSAAARRLVYPEGESEAQAIAGENERLIRVVFNGAMATASPRIAQMAMDCGIAASIVSASTRTIGGKVYGNMLLSVPAQQEVAERAVAFLQQDRDVIAEEVAGGV